MLFEDLLPSIDNKTRALQNLSRRQICLWQLLSPLLQVKTKALQSSDAFLSASCRSLRTEPRGRIEIGS